MPGNCKGVGSQGGLNLWVIKVNYCPLVCEHIYLKWRRKKRIYLKEEAGMKAVPIPSTKSVTFCNIDIFYWNVSNKVAAIPPQCQRCCWLPVSWGRIVVSCHLLSLSGAQSSSFCGLTPKEHIDKPSFSHQQIQYFWNLFYWCTYTAAHLSASADLLLQFGEFLLVHTEFLHLKSKHKRCWKFTHIWLNIFKTAQTSIQYSTNLAIPPQVWQLIIHKYKRVHIFPTKV